MLKLMLNNFSQVAAPEIRKGFPKSPITFIKNELRSELMKLLLPSRLPLKLKVPSNLNGSGIQETTLRN